MDITHVHGPPEVLRDARLYRQDKGILEPYGVKPISPKQSLYLHLTPEGIFGRAGCALPLRQMDILRPNGPRDLSARFIRQI